MCNKPVCFQKKNISWFWFSKCQGGQKRVSQTTETLKRHRPVSKILSLSWLHLWSCYGIWKKMRLIWIMSIIYTCIQWHYVFARKLVHICVGYVTIAVIFFWYHFQVFSRHFKFTGENKYTVSLYTFNVITNNIFMLNINTASYFCILLLGTFVTFGQV